MVFLRLCLQSVWIWRLSLQTVWFLRLRSSDIRTKAFPSHSAQGISESSVRVISDSKVIPLVISEGPFEHGQFRQSLWTVILIGHFWSLNIVFWPKFWRNRRMWIYISAIAMQMCYSALIVPLHCVDDFSTIQDGWGKSSEWVKWHGWQYQAVQDPTYMPNSTFWG